MADKHARWMSIEETIRNYLWLDFGLKSVIDYAVEYPETGVTIRFLNPVPDRMTMGHMGTLGRTLRQCYKVSLSWETTPAAAAPPPAAEKKRCPVCGAESGHVHAPDCETKIQPATLTEVIPAHVTPSPTEHPLDPDSAMLVIKRAMLDRFGAVLNTDYWFAIDYLGNRILIWVTPALKDKWPSLETAVLTDFQKFSLHRMELYIRDGDQTSIPFHGPTAGSTIPPSAAEIFSMEKNPIEAIASMMKRHFMANRGSDYWIMFSGYALTIVVSVLFSEEHPDAAATLKTAFHLLQKQFGYNFFFKVDDRPTNPIPPPPPRRRYKIFTIDDKTLADGYVRLRFIKMDPEPGRIAGPIMDSGVMTAQEAREFVNDIVMTSPAFTFNGQI